MTFHDVTLPEPIALGSSFSMEFKTDIIQQPITAQEYRYDKWSRCRYRADLSSGIKTRAVLRTLQDFYFARNGSQNSFRVRMPIDFTTAPDGRSGISYLDQIIGEGDGTTPDAFQLFKKYIDGGGFEYRRPIDKPVDSITPNTTMWIFRITPNGTLTPGYTPQIEGGGGSDGYDVDYDTGVLTLVSGLADGAFLIGGYEFDICMRFDEEIDEQFMLSLEDFDLDDLPSIPLIEEPTTAAVWEQMDLGRAVDHGEVTDSFFITPAEGRVHMFDPQNSLKIYIPDSESLPYGGPHLILINESTSIDISVYDENEVLVTTAMRQVATGSSTILSTYVHYNTNSKIWGAIKRT